MAADTLTHLKDWSTSVGSNYPRGTTAINGNLDDNLDMQQIVMRYELATRGSIASAATCDLGTKDEGALDITGTTTITGLGTVSAGLRKWVTFSGALTLTYNATSLILPTSANITTEADDTALFESLGGGNWKCLAYFRKTGQPVAAAFLMPDGTVAAPGLSFASDTDNGFYRLGANHWAVSVGGVKLLDLAAAAAALTGTLSVSGFLTTTGGFSFISATANSIIATGTGTLEITGHTTGGGRLSMLSTGCALYAGNNIPLYLITQGTSGLEIAAGGVGTGLRWKADEKHLTVVEVVGKPTITSGSGTPAGTIVGTDQAFSVTEGTTPGTTLVIAFSHSWANVPFVFPKLRANISCWVSAVSTSSVTITFASAPSTSDILDVWCIGYQTS